MENTKYRVKISEACCASCRFWWFNYPWLSSVIREDPPQGLWHARDHRGECRRHAPTGLRQDVYGGQSDPVFPAMFGGGWCGDYEVRPDLKAKQDEDAT